MGLVLKKRDQTNRDTGNVTGLYYKNVTFYIFCIKYVLFICYHIIKHKIIIVTFKIFTIVFEF